MSTHALLLTLLLALGLLPAGEARAEGSPRTPSCRPERSRARSAPRRAGRAARVVERLQPAEPALSWAQLLAYSAVLLSGLGFNEEALRKAQDSLRLAKSSRRTARRPHTPSTSRGYYLLGHWEESERHFLESQRLKQLHLPPITRRLGIALLNLGRIRKISVTGQQLSRRAVRPVSC